MLDNILIIILGSLVFFLAGIILVRRFKERGFVRIRQEAVNDVVASLQENISSGRIQDIAGSVSRILIKHLKCDKILFLKRKYDLLELNYFHNIRGFNREVFAHELNHADQKRLKLYQRINSISRLTSILSEEFVANLKQFGFEYFFPVFLRDNLYGIYFVKTKLPEQDPSLNLIATTLAFNLSSAYHVGLQDYRIRKYESQIRAIKGENSKLNKQIAEEDSVVLRSDDGSNNEYRHLLKIRNCGQLIPELLNRLKKTGEYSKLRFVIEANLDDTPFLSSGWNIDSNIEKTVKENYPVLIDELKPGEIIRLPDHSTENERLTPVLNKLSENDVDHLAVIKWGNNSKAILAFNTHLDDQALSGQLRTFADFAVPLVENVHRYEKAEEMSYTDGLTKMYNFRYFKKRLNEELHRAKRYNRCLALMIFDLDDLKVINDKHGHLAGDAMIKNFGTALSKSVRSEDIVSRYGGDEFCVIMPDTNRDEARYFIRRVIANIAENHACLDWADQKLKYTVSMGGAIYPNDAAKAKELVHSADMALLKAKQEGRNKALLFNDNFDINS